MRLRFDKGEQLTERTVPIGFADGPDGGAAVRGPSLEILVKPVRQRPIRWRRNELDHVQPRLLPQERAGKQAHVTVAVSWLNFMIPVR